MSPNRRLFSNFFYLTTNRTGVLSITSILTGSFLIGFLVKNIVVRTVDLVIEGALLYVTAKRTSLLLVTIGLTGGLYIRVHIGYIVVVICIRTNFLNLDLATVPALVNHYTAGLAGRKNHLLVTHSGHPPVVAYLNLGNNLTSLEGPGDCPLILGKCAYIELKSLASLNADNYGSSTLIGIEVNLSILVGVILSLGVEAKTSRNVEGVVTLCISSEGVKIEETICVGSLNLDRRKLNYLSGSLGNVYIVNTSCTAVGVLFSGSTIFIVSRIAILIKNGFLNARRYYSVSTCSKSIGNNSLTVVCTLNGCDALIVSNDVAICVNDTDPRSVGSTGGAEHNLNGSSTGNGKLDGTSAFLLNLYAVDSAVLITVVNLANGGEVTIYISSAISDVGLICCSTAVNKTKVPLVSLRTIVVRICLTTYRALAICEGVTCSVDLTLLYGSSTTNGTNLTVGKTGLGTGRSLTGNLFLFVTERSDFLSLGVTAYGTSESLLTCFGAVSFLSYLDAVSMLGALRSVVRIGLAALTLTINKVVFVRSNIIGILCATLTLTFYVGVGVFGSFRLGKDIARCKSEYHCNCKHKTSQNGNLSLHNKEPPFVFFISLR